MKRTRLVAAMAAAVTLLLATTACGSTGSNSASKTSGTDGASLLTYHGTDRQSQLEAAARKEGGLVWYTTTILDQVSNPLIASFKEKYPYLSVEVYRANSTGVTQRVVQEYKGNKYVVDVVDGTGTTATLGGAGFIQPFFSPELSVYPADLKSSKNLWGPQLQYFMVTAYNTKVMAPAQAPKTYSDLLNPALKGEMAWSTSSTSGAPEFIGNILTSMGSAQGTQYLKKLAEQKVHNLDQSGRAVLDQVVSGQFPLALNVFSDQVADSAAKGAPVAYVAMNPVFTQLSRASVAAKAPHPASAALFMDFMFSEAGQKIIQASGAIPARPGVDAKVKTLKPEAGMFKVNHVDDNVVEGQTPAWVKVYQSLFGG